ncbi:hypothetical protein [Niabella ginsenosidivorans]|nr:hypothetical protein [Niabella ginsenosidivorans]
MKTEVSYIKKDKIRTYLKLGKKLVQFAKWDRFFGRPTFDWIQLEACKDGFRATLMRSLDEGNAVFNDVYAFHTLNEEWSTYDELENPFCIGSWEEVWNWMQQYNIEVGQFVKPEDLSRIYQSYK